MSFEYSSSHSSPGYGSLYDRTYQQGYYADLWARIERPLLVEQLRRWAPNGGRVLDLACGTGRISGAVANTGLTVVGVDVSREMLKRARAAIPSGTFIEADIRDEPDVGSAFDVATCFRFFLNAEPELRRAMLSGAYKRLRPGGILLLNVHVNHSSPTGIAYRFRRRVVGVPANTSSPFDVQEAIADAGFRTVEVRFYGALPRIGWWYPRPYARMMEPLERLSSRLPERLRSKLSQAFLVVAQRPDLRA